MDEQFFLVMLDIFPIIALFAYGVKFRFKTPDFGDSSGLCTPITQQSRKAWAYAHDFAGMLAFIFGAFATLLVALKYIIYGSVPPIAVDLSVTAIQLVLVFIFIPITNAKTKSVFGDVPNKKKK